MTRVPLAFVAFALVLAACTAPRTEIVVRVQTDIAQGPTSPLSAIRIRVTSTDEMTPRFDQRFDLGVGASPVTLPATLGVVPRDANANRRIEVVVDAFQGDEVLFTRHAIATFLYGRTLALDIFLADRCRRPENRACAPGFTCGAMGCEAIERMMLPDFGEDAAMVDAGPSGADASEPDAGLDAGRDSAVDAGRDSAVDADRAIDAGQDSAIDTGCPDVCGGTCVDVLTDPLHCGGCAPCASVPGGAPTCDLGVCARLCDAGFVDTGGACVALAAPRPIAPISMGRVSRRAPTLRWDLPPGADGAHVDVCADPACTVVESAFDAIGTSGTVPIRLSTSPRVLHYFRLFARTAGVTATTASPTWAFAIPFADGVAETSWPALLDTDLDGYGEIAVGEPSTLSVSVYAGSATRPAAAPALRLSGAASSLFGASVAHAGDVNGDGLGDLVVGAPGASQAFVFLGTSAGLSSTGTRLDGPAGSRFGASVASAGDVDGDGFGDIVIGAPDADTALFFRGSFDGVRARAAVVLAGAPGSRFGAAVASAGDVDGDGFGDLVVGAPGADAAFVYRGGIAGVAVASVVALAGAPGSAFGSAVAGAGDTALLDGLSDVAIGAPTARTVQIFAGGATGVDATPDFQVTETSPETGISIAFGDVDLNGYDDLVVGSGGEIVYAYLSNPSGPGVRPGWNQTISPATGAMGFGRAVAIGESNADNYLDVMVGSPSSGTAYWCAGRASGALSADVTLTGTGGAGSDFGVSVACTAMRAPGRREG